MRMLNFIPQMIHNNLMKFTRGFGGGSDNISIIWTSFLQVGKSLMNLPTRNNAISSSHSILKIKSDNWHIFACCVTHFIFFLRLLSWVMPKPDISSYYLLQLDWQNSAIYKKKKKIMLFNFVYHTKLLLPHILSNKDFAWAVCVVRILFSLSEDDKRWWKEGHPSI